MGKFQTEGAFATKQNLFLSNFSNPQTFKPLNLSNFLKHPQNFRIPNPPNPFRSREAPKRDAYGRFLWKNPNGALHTTICYQILLKGRGDEL